MPINANSRYATGRQVLVEATRNQRTRNISFVYTHDPVPPSEDVAFVYTTVAGDRLDMLAFRFAGDNRLWWVLADINKFFRFPMFLPVGIDLKIPTAEVFRKYGASV